MNFWKSIVGSVFGILCVILNYSACNMNSPESTTEMNFGASRFISAIDQEILMFSDGRADSTESGGAIPIRFGYDFYIDTTEVTREEFQSLMGWLPPPPSGRDEARLPVTMVTWYDAILFCNARSKKYDLDTVYEYVSLTRTGKGSVNSIVGLGVDLTRNGFRLPTESEWELAAHGIPQTLWTWGDTADTSLAASMSWYSKNAKARPHTVASKLPNRNGLYDMSGNVYEWVNDWLGRFPLTGSTNYVGSAIPNAEQEVPVKGGGYNSGLGDLLPSRRISTYPTLRSSATPYLGFRCALGSISKPVVGAESGTAFTSPVQCIAPSLNQRIGRATKIAFINVVSDSKRNLALVDFSENPPQVRQFEDNEAVFYPAISPDGNWVAYCNRIAGSAETSSIFVRSINLKMDVTSKLRIESGFGPRWWVNPETNDTCLVYSSSGMINESQDWSKTKTYALAIRGGNISGTPIILVDSGGYYGGISRDGRFLSTGYTRLRTLDRTTNTASIGFVGPANGKSPGDTSQVCNVSLAPDSSGHSLFLDFGYSEKSTLTGTPYDLHEFAFISDPSGKVNRWFRSPPHELWEDLKWSNHIDFAVAGTIIQDSRPYVYVLNLKDSTYVPVLKGKELEQADLWLGEKWTPSTSSDSLGQYNSPSGSIIREHLAIKFRPFWNAHDSIEVAFVGHSRVEMGVNTSLLKSAKGFNFGYTGADLFGTSRIIRDYLLNHCPNLKAIVLDPQLEFLYEPPINGDWSWSNQVAENQGYQYDKAHNFWKSGIPGDFLTRLNAVPQPQFSQVDPTGWSAWWPGPDLGWVKKPTIVKGLDWDVQDLTYQKNLLFLKELLSEISSHGITVITVIFPQNPAYFTEGSFGLYGPSTTTAKDVVHTITELEKEIPRFTVYDAYNFGQNDYTSADAYDDSHLNAQGAQKLTQRLDSLLAEKMNR